MLYFPSQLYVHTWITTDTFAPHRKSTTIYSVAPDLSNRVLLLSMEQEFPIVCILGERTLIAEPDSLRYADQRDLVWTLPRATP